MSHWHVIENTPGYLPESEPFVTEDRQEAESYARDLAEELREEYGRRNVRGNARDGYYASRGANDLGRVIEVTECFEAGCLADLADEG
jgi:hypothetical protein